MLMHYLSACQRTLLHIGISHLPPLSSLLTISCAECYKNHGHSVHAGSQSAGCGSTPQDNATLSAAATASTRPTQAFVSVQCMLDTSVRTSVYLISTLFDSIATVLIV